MAFKKNWFSYFVWGTYAFFAGAFYIAALFALLNCTTLNNIYAKCGITFLSLVFLAGVFAIIRNIQKDKSYNKKHNGIETLLMFVIFVIAVLLRLKVFTNGMEEAAYYEIAKVTGAGITPIAHGAQYMYICLLRGLFMVFGNYFQAGITLQLFLYSLFSLVWYYGIRRYAGRVTAVFVYGVLMLVPKGIEQSITYSPKVTYLLLLGIGFLFVAHIACKNKNDDIHHWYFWIAPIITGLAIGYLTYLDVSGLVLWIPYLFLFFTIKSGRLPIIIQWIVSICSFSVSFFGALFIDAVNSNSGFTQTWNVWCTLFQPKGISFDFITGFFNGNSIIDLSILSAIAALIVLGLPGFFIKLKDEIQLVWYLMVIGGVALPVFGFMYSGMTGDLLLLLLISTLCGAGLKAIVMPKEKRQVKETKTEEKKKTTEEPNSPSEEKTVDKVVDKVVDKQIHYIENPLPLPKKPEKKVLDYAKKISDDQLCYEVEVDDNDDFDLK